MEMYDKKKIAETFVREDGTSVTRDTVREVLEDDYAWDTKDELNQVADEIFGLIKDAQVIVWWDDRSATQVSEQESADVD